MDILDGLNDRQRQAATAIDGRIRVIAGAGSGKTKALTHRYAYLVEEVGINPGNILCLTFTNKAAQEMKTRIARMVDAGNFNDFVSTIHGFCVKVLRRDIYRLGFPRTFKILDEDDEKTLAKQVMDDLGLDRKVITANQFVDNVAMIKSKRSDYIEALLVAEGCRLEKIEEKFFDPQFAEFVRRQQKFFALGFEDLINVTLYILNNYPDVRSYWQHQFDYVMVDETQDCNRKDWEIVNILSELKGNIFVVGDPDQAIYEWRGAEPDMFVNFKSDVDIVLNENYRSTQSILNVANSVIHHNVNRLDKSLFTRKSGDAIVVHYHAPTEPEESKWIVKEIKSLHSAGNAYSDVAILYRASYLSRSVEQALMNNRIPYVVYGGVRFFDRKEIKDALSYLRLVDSSDDLAFLRIVNVPSRKLGDTFKKRLMDVAKKEGRPLYDTLCAHLDDADFRRAQARDFVQLIERARALRDKMPISELLKKILDDSGLTEAYRTDGDEDRLENIKELGQSIVYYEEKNANNEISLTTYLQDVALYTNMDYRRDNVDSVKLMTIHQSKGLEFPYVFVCGLSDGIMPSHRALRERTRRALEEERRLMYVAVTRAEKKLYLTESEGYSYAVGEKFPSRFLAEIERSLFETKGKMDDNLWHSAMEMAAHPDFFDEEDDDDGGFYPGMMVVHKAFGEGMIVSCDDESSSCVVRFANGERSIRQKFLTPLN